MFVKKGQLLARIDETELRAQVEIARVKVKDAERNHARAISSHENQLISDEAFEQIVSDRESAEAELVGRNILLDYTRIVAPFSGFIAERAVRLGREHHGQPASVPHLRLRSAAVPHSGAGEGAIAGCASVSPAT